MAAKKLITVFGATGAQGGSVVRALLEDSAFAVRAVTRDACKPAAVRLKEAGAEVVAADLDDAASVERALTGAYGAFVVTNFWEHFSKEKEVTQGKRIADLTLRLRLRHVIYSGLENVRRLSGGSLEVQHFDSKGEVEEYFREICVPMTSVRLAFYYQNLLTLCRPQKKDADTYQLVIPMGDVPMDGISVDDLGAVVCSILKKPSQYIGKDVGLSGDKLTIKEYADIMSRVTGKTIVDSQITPEAYGKLGFPGVNEMLCMFLFYHTRPDRNVEETRALNPEALTFQQFMEANKDAFKDL